MPQNLSRSAPGTDLETTNSTAMVLTAYAMTMTIRGSEPKAFEAAVRAWRERNPQAAHDDAARAVATIICNKL